MHNEFTNLERAEVLTQALPYIKKYSGKIVVIKYGGNAMINEELKQQVMEDIALLWLIGVKVVLIHGGGPEISETMKKFGKKSEFVNGLRVTDKETVDIVQMVLAGKVNKTLVNLLQMKGGHAVGLSGIDGGILEATMKDEALGYVGEVTKIRNRSGPGFVTEAEGRNTDAATHVHIGLAVHVNQAASLAGNDLHRETLVGIGHIGLVHIHKAHRFSLLQPWYRRLRRSAVPSEWSGVHVRP